MHNAVHLLRIITEDVRNGSAFSRSDAIGASEANNGNLSFKIVSTLVHEIVLLLAHCHTKLTGTMLKLAVNPSTMNSVYVSRTPSAAHVEIEIIQEPFAFKKSVRESNID